MAAKKSYNKAEWEFFRDADGKIKFNALCEECARDCKQSFKVMILACPQWQKKEEIDK